MTWSVRKLPPDWKRIRQRVLERDGHCCRIVNNEGVMCGRPASDVHHITQGNNHSPDNLIACCRWHHSRLTSKQANAARKRVTQRRPPEDHPGILK